MTVSIFSGINVAITLQNLHHRNASAQYDLAVHYIILTVTLRLHLLLFT